MTTGPEIVLAQRIAYSQTSLIWMDLPEDDRQSYLSRARAKLKVDKLIRTYGDASNRLGLTTYDGTAEQIRVALVDQEDARMALIEELEKYT